MKTGWTMRLGATLLVLVVFTVPSRASSVVATATPEPATRVPLFLPAKGQIEASAAAPLVREIDDPHLGARWLLLRDRSHPGGPGRMVPVAEFRKEAEPGQTGRMSALTAPSFDPESRRSVIRAGDRLIVEQHTTVIEARLEAVALGAAAIGSSLNVRLRIGGKLLRVVALAPGRAALPLEPEVRP